MKALRHEDVIKAIRDYSWYARLMPRWFSGHPAYSNSTPVSRAVEEDGGLKLYFGAHAEPVFLSPVEGYVNGAVNLDLYDRRGRELLVQLECSEIARCRTRRIRLPSSLSRATEVRIGDIPFIRESEGWHAYGLPLRYWPEGLAPRDSELLDAELLSATGVRLTLRAGDTTFPVDLAPVIMHYTGDTHIQFSMVKFRSEQAKESDGGGWHDIPYAEPVCHIYNPGLNAQRQQERQQADERIRILAAAADPVRGQVFQDLTVTPGGELILVFAGGQLRVGRTETDFSINDLPLG